MKTKTTKKTTTTKTKPVSSTKAKAAVEALVTTIAADLEAGAEKKAAKPAKKAAVKAAPVADDLKVRLYSKGEFYFGKLAAARINGLPQMAVEVKGKTITLTATKSAKDAQPIMFSHGAPVLRVAKLLADSGWSKTTQDLIAKPVGAAGFMVVVK